MKKAFDSKKLSTPTQILRRVLSKTSNSIKCTITPQSSNTSMEENNNAEDICKQTREQFIKPTINIEAELLLLKQQIANLQTAVTSMQNETEKKEIAIANLAREKERLAGDLRKQQRTANTLKQQLDEEREFYYKEKELYCQEMNDCKKLKKSLKHGDYKSQLEYYKKETSRLKESLTETLEANYNLSVKFLRMKNTKYCLKNRLKKLEVVHERAISEFNIQLENLKSELLDVVDREMQVPIPPSNKKYLQIIKQNGVLTHDNLCLRLEVDRLSLEMERLKMLQVRNETNNKLKYINRKKGSKTDLQNEKKSSGEECKSDREDKYNPFLINHNNNEEELIFFTNENDSYDKKGNNLSNRKESETSIRKIFEKEIKCGIPTITVITDDKQIKLSEDLSDTRNMNFDLIQLTDNPSQTLTHTSEFTQCYDAVRTQSAPEIVQTSLFVNDT